MAVLQVQDLFQLSLLKLGYYQVHTGTYVSYYKLVISLLCCQNGCCIIRENFGWLKGLVNCEGYQNHDLLEGDEGVKKFSLGHSELFQEVAQLY